MNNIIEYIANSPNPIFLPHLLKTFYPQFKNDLSYKAFEMRIRRLLKRLEKEDMIELTKIDGLIQITPKQKLVYLIKRRESFTKSVTLRRISFERINAIKIAQSVSFLEDETTKDEIMNWFDSYLSRIETTKIILLPKEEYSNVLFPKVMKYKTRFNDKYIKRKNLKKYNKLFAYASKHYKYALFLTLTTNPHMWKNLYSSYKASYYAWNRFRYYVKKWIGKKFPYILVHEFTQTGLLHFHIVIFGSKRLVDWRELESKWEKVGLGKWTWIYTLVNRNGQFVWLREKPKGVKSKDIQTYLSKYLKKALNDEKQLMFYWLSGKRFFTHSKDFPMEAEEKKGFVSYYFYYGSFSIWNIPFWIYQIAVDYG